jgi:hypothetical protein
MNELSLQDMHLMLYKELVCAQTILHIRNKLSIFNAVVRPVLTCGPHCVCVIPSGFCVPYKLQAKLLKAALGLKDPERLHQINSSVRCFYNL